MGLRENLRLFLHQLDESERKEEMRKSRPEPRRPYYRTDGRFDQLEEDAYLAWMREDLDAPVVTKKEFSWVAKLIAILIVLQVASTLTGWRF